MSRHKFVKRMNYEAELYVFDGADAYDEDASGATEELSAEDKEQMQEGNVKVRSILGPEVPVTDKEVDDALWHYYYDVEKAVTYLLNLKSTSPELENKVAQRSKDPATFSSWVGRPQTCSSSFSAVDFFQDCPWLNIPLRRQGVILIEPLYPRGRLLGGASQSPGTPKVSKLAALAAAKKKKELEKNRDGEVKAASSSIALLDKLNMGMKPSTEQPSISVQALKENKNNRIDSEGLSRAGNIRRYPTRRPKTPSPPLPPVIKQEELLKPDDPDPAFSDLVAKPSPFARIILGSLSNRLPLYFLANHFSPSYSLQGKLPESNPFAGPSPDDIVAKAQSASKGFNKSKSTNKAGGADKTIDVVTNIVSKVTIDDMPRTKSRNLNVVAEFNKSEKKNAANFVVIGHVDAGKSTLMGRLLYDLKVVDQRTIDRYRKEAQSIGKSSFALAWVLDQGSEERSRGVTMDIAMNKFETATTRFTILDAPGHRDFIPNMIAGASQADFAILVIDASIGSFESGLRGETKQHALLVRSMGVSRLVVVINKLDTVAWSQDRFTDIQQQMSAFLSAAGFPSKNTSFIPCSGLTGDNIIRRASAREAAWYSGPLLIEALESADPISRALDKPLRLQIGDIFRGGVQNPLSISGRIDAGSVQIGDRVLAIPSGEAATVKGIEADSEMADWAVAGQNVVLHLTEIDAIHLKAGDVLCPPTAPVQSVTEFVIKILAFEFVTLSHVDIHRGRLHAPGQVGELLAILDKGTGAVMKKKPRLVKPGEVARVRVRVLVDGGVPLEKGARVVLRAGGETVAAGLLE